MSENSADHCTSQKTVLNFAWLSARGLVPTMFTKSTFAKPHIHIDRHVVGCFCIFHERGNCSNELKHIIDIPANGLKNNNNENS